MRGGKRGASKVEEEILRRCKERGIRISVCRKNQLSTVSRSKGEKWPKGASEPEKEIGGGERLEQGNRIQGEPGGNKSAPGAALDGVFIWRRNLTE